MQRARERKLLKLAGDGAGDNVVEGEIGDNIEDKIADVIGDKIGDAFGDKSGDQAGDKLGDDSPPYLEAGDDTEEPLSVHAGAAAPPAEGSAESLDAVRKRLHERLGDRGGGKDRASEGLRADEL